MRRVTRNGVLAVAAASGAMAVAMPAYADAGADGAAAGSPGVSAGNAIQLPVHVPVNVCGNTVNVAGLLNPAAGNACVNEDAGERNPSSPGSSTTSAAGSGTHGSPGVLSGNGVQLPVDLPVNISGNSVNVAGAGNAAAGNSSANTPGERPDRQERPAPPAPPRTLPAPAPHAVPQEPVALAETGAGRTLPVLGTGAAFFLAGVALYRRARVRAGG
ncbi:chaplin [Streptomyces sp. CHD11]|uniref:chaplin n=1 Tax=Streptomyces sp. CHD11 TaxID=2741325 RepID=UPI001BFC9E28|nr:chaplin [Streptomyces sp. CHD11]MBT3155109.1 chaplin [Streptomyces sp. CHD11]